MFSVLRPASIAWYHRWHCARGPPGYGCHGSLSVPLHQQEDVCVCTGLHLHQTLRHDNHWQFDCSTVNTINTYYYRIPWVLCIYLNICYLVDWVINTNLVENLKSLYSKRGSLFHAKMGLNLCQDVEKYVNSSPSLPLPLFLFHILSLSHTLQAKYFSITFRHNW